MDASTWHSRQPPEGVVRFRFSADMMDCAFLKPNRVSGSSQSPKADSWCESCRFDNTRYMDQYLSLSEQR